MVLSYLRSERTEMAPPGGGPEALAAFHPGVTAADNEHGAVESVDEGGADRPG